MATPTHTAHSWRFGVYEVDAQREELRRSGSLVKLREQSFRILVFLLKHAGDLVTREDLRRVLWPADTYVDFDHSLNTAVMKLREALGDTADKPLYIETIPKRGYRFIAPVSPVAASANQRVTIAADSGVVTEPRAATVPDGRSRTARIAGGLLGLALLAGAGFLVYLRTHHLAAPERDGSAAPTHLQIVPVTSAPGIAAKPSLSPDGRDIAYIWDGPEQNRFEVYVMRIGSDTPLQITHSKGFSKESIAFPTWSPDGRVIAFTRCERGNGSVYLVPAFGGSERRLTSAGCQYFLPSPLAWNADGTQLLMTDRCSTSGQFGLVVFSFMTGEKRCLTDADPSVFDMRYRFSLSPDGGTVAFIPPTDSQICEIYTMPMAGGQPKLVLKEEQPCTSLMWTPDARSIVFWSERSTLPSLWRVPATGGEVKRETVYPDFGSFSKDGRRFVYADWTNRKAPEIWRVDLARAGGRVLSNRRVISSQLGDLDAQPSPDGSKVVWMSTRTGFNEIWVSDASGANPLQLTHLKQYSGTPRWSPDGKWITFDSYGSKGAQIYIADSEGRNLRAITEGAHPNVVSSWSRDGEWIYFASKRTGRMEVWRHSLKSGKYLQITTHGGFNAFESFDGRAIYFSRFDEPGIWSVPLQGGEESLVIADMPQVSYWGHLAVTEAGLYFLNADAEPRARIEFYDFTTHSISPVLNLEKRAALGQPSLSATKDGRTIYYTQLDPQTVIKMMEFSK